MITSLYALRYTARGARTHLVPRWVGVAHHALCGVFAEYGTASQAEYGRAESLPICAKCLALVPDAPDLLASPSALTSGLTSGKRSELPFTDLNPWFYG